MVARSLRAFRPSRF